MTWLYSPANNQFYDSVINAAAIPVDAIEITTARYAELMAAQADGSTIAANEDTGVPVVVSPLALDLETKQAIAARAVQDEAERRIVAVMPIYQQLNLIRAQVAGETLTQEQLDAFAAIDAIREASNTIEADVATADEAEIDAFNPRTRSEWPNVVEN